MCGVDEGEALYVHLILPLGLWWSDTLWRWYTHSHGDSRGHLVEHMGSPRVGVRETQYYVFVFMNECNKCENLGINVSIPSSSRICTCHVLEFSTRTTVKAEKQISHFGYECPFHSHARMSGGHTVTLSKFRNPVLAAFPLWTTQCSALINSIKTKNVTQEPESNNSAMPYGH